MYNVARLSQTVKILRTTRQADKNNQLMMSGQLNFTIATARARQLQVSYFTIIDADDRHKKSS
jgi:hypothetical protein